MNKALIPPTFSSLDKLYEMRISMRYSLLTIFEGKEEEERRTTDKDVGSTSLVLKQPTKDRDKPQGRNRNNTTKNSVLYCEITKDDNQNLLVNKLSLYKHVYIPNRLRVLQTSTQSLSLSLGEFAVLLQRYDPDSIETERITNFRNLIQITFEKMFKTGSRKYILFNKHTDSEINGYNLSQNANTTPEPDTEKESILNEINEPESAPMIERETMNKGPLLGNRKPATEEANTFASSQLSFEDQFGHLSIFAQQSSPGKESGTDPEEIAKSAINGMLAKCIENLHKPTVNSRLSGRNAHTLVSNINIRNPISKMRRCSTQEMVHLQNELERKFSTEKNNLEQENDHQFSHGDGEALQQSADDIEQSTENMECLRRQRMERLQQLRNVLEQKKGERKDLDNRSKLKNEMEPNSEMVRGEHIDEDGEIDEENEGVVITKAPTYIDVHIVPPRRGIRSIYREVERVQCSSSTENSDITDTDRKGCDDDSCPLGLSDLNFRSLIDAKKESKPESRSSPSISRHSSATINRRHSPAAEKSNQGTHIDLPSDQITSAQDSENGEPKTEKDLYSMYEKTGINSQRGVQYQRPQTAVNVSDADFWKDLNDGKVGNTRQLMHDSEENVEVSQWATRDLHPSEENEIGDFFEECFKSSGMQLDKLTNSAANSAEFRRRVKPEKRKNSLKEELKEKTRKKERGNKTPVVSLQAETESVMQKRAYLENTAHLEESEEMLEEKRKELRDAENLLFFKTMARDGGFLQPNVKAPPSPHGLTSRNHTLFTGFTKMNSRLFTPSDVDKGILSTPSRRSSDAFPDDHHNFISENQAEENLMFFRYIARNKSFFKFNESN